MCKSQRVLLVALGALIWLAAVALTGEERSHTVATGDTLSALARLYGVTVQQIADRNQIDDPNLVFPGQVLAIPGVPAAPPPTRLYTVEPGDTLSQIAERYDVTVAKLVSLNRLADPHHIVIGQRLRIPVPAPPPDDALPVPQEHPNWPELERIIDELSAADGVDARVIKAIAWTESGFQQRIVSPTGAVGVMQIQPATAAWLESDIFGEELNEDESAYDNVRMGVRLFKLLMIATKGDTHKAIASYYQGFGVTSRGTIYDETREYVDIVSAVRRRYWP